MFGVFMIRSTFYVLFLLIKGEVYTIKRNLCYN